MKAPLRQGRAVAAAGALAVVALGVLGLRTVLPAWRDVHPARVVVRDEERTAARSLLPGLEDVELRTADGVRLVGWFAPGTSRSAVVLVHGLGANRAALLPEAAILARHGHGVLLYDSRASGESGGTTATWGDRERLDVRAALEWLLRRPDVDAGRIGVYGFSVGATAVALAAAEDARFRAVALGPTWTSLHDELHDKFRARGARWSWLAEQTFREVGTDVEALAPERVVARIGTRPLLLVSGTADPDTPPAVMARMLAHAAPGAEQWLVAGAGHGGYGRVDPVGLEHRFAGFFDRALAPAAHGRRAATLRPGPGGPTAQPALRVRSIARSRL